MGTAADRDKELLLGAQLLEHAERVALSGFPVGIGTNDQRRHFDLAGVIDWPGMVDLPGVDQNPVRCAHHVGAFGFGRQEGVEPGLEYLLLAPFGLVHGHDLLLPDVRRLLGIDGTVGADILHLVQIARRGHALDPRRPLFGVDRGVEHEPVDLVVVAGRIHPRGHRAPGPADQVDLVRTGPLEDEVDGIADVADHFLRPGKGFVLLRPIGHRRRAGRCAVAAQVDVVRRKAALRDLGHPVVAFDLEIEGVAAVGGAVDEQNRLLDLGRIGAGRQALANVDLEVGLGRALQEMITLHSGSLAPARARLQER